MFKCRQCHWWRHFWRKTVPGFCHHNTERSITDCLKTCLWHSKIRWWRRTQTLSTWKIGDMAQTVTQIRRGQDPSDTEMPVLPAWKIFAVVHEASAVHRGCCGIIEAGLWECNIGWSPVVPATFLCCGGKIIFITGVNNFHYRCVVQDPSGTETLVLPAWKIFALLHEANADGEVAAWSGHTNSHWTLVVLLHSSPTATGVAGTTGDQPMLHSQSLASIIPEQLRWAGRRSESASIRRNCENGNWHLLSEMISFSEALKTKLLLTTLLSVISKCVFEIGQRRNIRVLKRWSWVRQPCKRLAKGESTKLLSRRHTQYSACYTENGTPAADNRTTEWSQSNGRDSIVREMLDSVNTWGDN